MLFGLTDYLPETALSVFDNLEFLLRIIMSGVLGLLIGLERTKRQKDAGIRTHCIIAVTSAAFMILSKYAFVDLTSIASVKSADPARIAAQVVSGISFLGAGVIFKDKNASIKGLTTAAGIWATAAVGMSIGAGLYWLGIFEAVAVIISQMVLHRFPIANDALSAQELCVRLADSDEAQKLIQMLVKSHRGYVEQSDIARENGILCMKLIVRLKDPITHDDSMALIMQHPNIYQISV